MIATLLKLSFAGIRLRLLASTLTILLTGAAAATIVLTLEVGTTARDPWMRTFNAPAPIPRSSAITSARNMSGAPR